MRLLILSFLLVASVSGFGGMMEEMMEMKKWTMMKAMEGCLGEDLMKQYMLKCKRAAAKCYGVDAPELDLPMFNNPYRLVNMLLDPSEDSDDDGDSFGRIMEKYIQMQMLKEIGGGEKRPRSRRFKRQADEEVGQYDVAALGERLNKKLTMKKKELNDKMNNMTCVFRELGYLDSQDKYDEAGIKSMMEEVKLSDPWLKEKMTEGCEMCRAMVKAVPKKYWGKCMYGEDLGKVKFYKKCMMKTKLKVCMKFDMKQKLEKNFGSIDELTSATGLKENDLFHVVKQMMTGPEKMMM